MIELAKINIVTGYYIELMKLFCERYLCIGENLLIDVTDGTKNKLHPKYEAESADTVIRSAKIQSRIICTFSETLIMRLRRRIAEGKLNLKDVKLFLVEENYNQLEYKEFTFNEYGDFVCDSGWPLDFFKTCYDDVRAIQRARRKKEENNEC